MRMFKVRRKWRRRVRGAGTQGRGMDQKQIQGTGLKIAALEDVHVGQRRARFRKRPGEARWGME